MAWKSAEVEQEDAGLHEPVHRAPGGVEDGGEVRERLPRLRRDVALDRRVPRLEPELPGDEDELAGDDRLVVGRALERCGSGLGADHALLHGRVPFVSCRPDRPRERDAERLEDRRQGVARVLALDQPDVDRQPRLLGKPAEEARREVGAEPAGPRQVGVRGDERPV